ncbi:MAG: hypothetical protein MHMPM18_001219 [Marteilia pararefringens]
MLGIVLELHHLPEGVNNVSLNFGFNEYQFQTESEMVKSYSTSTCVLNYDAEFTVKSRGMFLFKIKCNKNKTLGYAALDILEVTDDEAQIHKLPCFAKKEHAKQASKATLPATNLSTLPIILSLKASGIIDFFESPNSRGKTIKRSISSANLSKIKIFGKSKSHDAEDSDVSPAFNLQSVQKLNFQNSLPLNSPQKSDTITEASASKEKLSTSKVGDANTTQIFNHPDKHQGGKQLHAVNEQKNIPKLDNTCHRVDDVLIDKHIEQDDAKPNVYPHTDHFSKDDIFTTPWWSNQGSASVASASNLASISQFETEMPSSNICRACEEAYYNKILKYEKMIKDLKSQNYSLESDMIRLTNKLADIGNEIFEEELLGIEKRK